MYQHQPTNLYVDGFSIHSWYTHTRRWYSVILLFPFKLCSGVSNHHMQRGNVIPTTAMAIVQAPFTTGAVKMVQHNFNSSGCSWSSSSPRILSLYLSPSLLRNQWRKTVYDKVIIAMYDFLWWGDEYTGSWRAETDDVFCVVCWLKTPHCCDICIVCYARALCFALSATSLSFSPCWRHEPKHLHLLLSPVSIVCRFFCWKLR